MKQIFSDKDQMLANLVADETANLADGNSQISSFAHSSMDRMNKAQNIIGRFCWIGWLFKFNYSRDWWANRKLFDARSAFLQGSRQKGGWLPQIGSQNFGRIQCGIWIGHQQVHVCIEGDNCIFFTIYFSVLYFQKSALLLNEEMSTKLVESLEKINELQKCCNSQRDQIGKMVGTLRQK